MNKCKGYSKMWFLLLLLVVFVAGCGSAGGSGTLGVSLTDAPACGFDEVNVTVVKVRVHQSGSASENDAGWADITLNPARKINLLDLNNGALFNLGETPLAVGHYTQLRLVLDPNTGSSVANSVVLSGTTTEISLDTPSAVQSGIKLVNEFDVADGQRVDLVLDFDACKSIVTHGGGTYALKPVIKVIPFEPNGIKGFVEIPLLDGVMVTAQQNGVIVQSTAPIAINGEFFLARLAPGNYDVVLTANGHATAVIAGVPVASTTSTTVVSTSDARITLPVSTTNNTVSGTVTLSPTSSTEVAYVAAKQTFTSGPTVTVKFVAADLASGAYTMTLPVGAPMFGQYSATLPIGLVDQTTVAGQYTIEASATGYVTQSVSKDISAGNATQSFTLVP